MRSGSRGEPLVRCGVERRGRGRSLAGQGIHPTPLVPCILHKSFGTPPSSNLVVYLW